MADRLDVFTGSVWSLVCVRVVINVPHKKFEGDIVGKHGTVLSVTHNGWVKVQVRSSGHGGASSGGSSNSIMAYSMSCVIGANFPARLAWCCFQPLLSVWLAATRLMSTHCHSIS